MNLQATALEAKHAPGAATNSMFFKAPGLTSPVPPGLDLRVAPHAVYRDRVCASLTFLFGDMGPAKEAIAFANNLASEIAEQAQSEQDGSPLVAAVEAAGVKAKEAERRIADAQAEVRQLEDQYKAAVARDEYPRGVHHAISEAKDRVGFCIQQAERRRREHGDARERLAAAGRAAWAAEAGKRRAELTDQRAELLREAEEYFLRLSARLLEVAACEQILEAGPPAPAPARARQIDDHVPPPPANREPVATARAR